MYQVTLGIPVYNAADLIEETLLSALNQTFSNIEFLLIDDKGDSMDIVRRVVANHPRRKHVRIIDQVYNQGVGAARNAIIDNATGKYLFTMDCDDVIVPECINLLYQAIEKNPVDFVAASFVRRDLKGTIYPNCQYQNLLREKEEYPLVKYRYVDGSIFSVASWNKLYNLLFLRKNQIRCIPHFHVEDPWFTYQVILCTTSFHLLPDITLKFTMNPLSVTSRKESEGYSEFIADQFVQTQKNKAQYIQNLTDKIIYTALLVDLMQMSLYHGYRIALSGVITKDKKHDMLTQLLSVFFLQPKVYPFNRIWLNYMVLRAFYSLPMSLKREIVIFFAKIKISHWLHKWIHFK